MLAQKIMRSGVVVAPLLGVAVTASAQVSLPPLPSQPPELVEAQRRYDECVAQNSHAMAIFRAGHSVHQLVEIRDGMRLRPPPSPGQGIPTLAEIETALNAEWLNYKRLGGTASAPEAIGPERSPCPTPLESIAGQRNQQQPLELRQRVIVPRNP